MYIFISYVEVNPSGDWQRGAREFGLPLKKVAGVSRGSFHGSAAPAVVSREYEARDQGWAAPVMTAEAEQLLSLIKSSRNHMGASRYFFFAVYMKDLSLPRQELSRQRTTAGLEQLLEVLVQEGHIYTTCDQDHFMATDA